MSAPEKASERGSDVDLMIQLSDGMSGRQADGQPGT